MPAPISVVRVQPFLANRRLGITVGEATFSDGLVVRFHVLSRDPVAVRLLSDKPLPTHEQALLAWLAEQPGCGASGIDRRRVRESGAGPVA